MKNLKLLILTLIFSQFSYAQKVRSDVFYSASPVESNGMDFSIKLDSASRIGFHNPVIYQPLTNLVYLENGQNIELFASIHPDSLKYYRYSILEDDKTDIMIDGIPSERQYNRLSGVFSLGRFFIRDKKLVVTYYKITNRSKIGKIIVYNKTLKPAKISVLGLRVVTEHGTGISFKDPSGLADHSSLTWWDPKDSSIITMNDDVQGIFVAIENTELDFLYYLFLKEKRSGKIVYSSNSWDYDFLVPVRPHMIIPRSVLEQNTAYELIVLPKLSFLGNARALPTKPLVFNFRLVSNLSKKQAIQYGLILFVLCGVIFGAVVIYIKKRAAKKLVRLMKQNEIAKLQLSVVRAQLNPHFLFNALAGIQNLMNKNEIDHANRYLGKFARLTRNVLNDQELVSLMEEKNLLDDYLQMEQLRFGFQYQLNTGPDLDVENIEIPSMLLQPFVENAVKHGIAEKGEAGTIAINFIRQSDDLVLIINDNGNGFEADKTYAGLGLTLSKNRISLLNTIYTSTPIVLDLQSGSNGTTVKITLTQWI